jgi:hypothetical protein
MDYYTDKETGAIREAQYVTASTPVPSCLPLCPDVFLILLTLLGLCVL